MKNLKDKMKELGWEFETDKCCIWFHRFDHPNHKKSFKEWVEVENYLSSLDN